MNQSSTPSPHPAVRPSVVRVWTSYGNFVQMLVVACPGRYARTFLFSFANMEPSGNKSFKTLLLQPHSSEFKCLLDFVLNRPHKRTDLDFWNFALAIFHRLFPVWGGGGGGGWGWIRLIVGFQPLMVISPTASWIRWCMQVQVWWCFPVLVNIWDQKLYWCKNFKPLLFPHDKSISIFFAWF